MTRGVSRRQAGQVWAKLRESEAAEAFDARSVEGLPAPARRYLLHAIAPGAPLARSVELRMEGSIVLDPGMPAVSMRAEELLATPRGFVWRARIASGPRRTRGFDLYADGRGALRWWLWGLLPVANASGPDVDRSAAGRVAAEALWLPSSLLPGKGAEWEAIDDRSAKAKLSVGGEHCELTLSIAKDGRLERVSMPRWRTSAEAGKPGYVLFGADGICEERTFGGYTIPTRLRFGWRLGADDEEAFLFPAVTGAVFR